MGFKGILTVVNMVFSGHSMIQSSGSTSGWLIPEEKHAHSEVPNMIKPWFLGGSSVKKPWLMCETWWTINIGIQENIQPMSRGKWIIGNSGSLPNDGLVDILGVVSHQGPTIANLHHLLWNRELALYLHDERNMMINPNEPLKFGGVASGKSAWQLKIHHFPDEFPIKTPI